MPLLIPLRDFTRLQKEKQDLSLLGYLELRARTDLSLERAHRAFFESALLMGEAVVLLDGLDEVGNAAARQRLASTIRAFQARYPACPFWVTSRIYGYTGDVRLPVETFYTTRLDRLNDDQIGEFIDRWYALQPNPREREERAASLRHAIAHAPGVQRLATNPLLLTLMAFIHQGLRRLPQDRGELYEKCIEMLLKTWQEAKWEEGRAPAHPFEQVDLFNYVNTQKDYLSHLALSIQERRSGGEDEEERGLVARADALGCLVERHLAVARRTHPDLTEDRARTEMEHFLDYLSDRTGLLVDRGGDQLSFIHLSFQEYLSAWIFTCQGGKADPRFFIKNLGNPAWEEVLLLRLYILIRTGGEAGAKAFDRIVTRLFRELKFAALLSVFGAGRKFRESGWLTLARALRDNLQFKPADEERIVRRAVDFWLISPSFSGEWFAALEEICLFAVRPRLKLEAFLRKALSEAPPRFAVACLHLQARILGASTDASNRLGQRADLSRVIPDLVVFTSKPDLSPLVARAGTIASWLAALRALDSPEIYSFTLDLLGSSTLSNPARLSAATGLLWSKIVEDLQSRAGFMKAQRAISDFPFAVPGRIAVSAKFHSLEMPWNGARCQLQRPSIPLSSGRKSKEIFCPELARVRMAEDIGASGRIVASLLRWSQRLMSVHLATLDNSGSLSDDIDRFATRFSRIFTRESSELYSDAFDLFGGFTGHSSPSFVFVRDFSSVFTYAFAQAFVHDFSRSFISGLSHYFALAFGDVFSGDFANALVRDYGFLSETADTVQFSELSMKHKTVLRIIGERQFWGRILYSSDLYLENGPRSDLVVSRLSNPYAAPLLITHIFMVAATSHSFALSRYLATRFPNGKATAKAATEWLRQHPISVYATALAWEEMAEATCDVQPRLEGPHGALMLAHAAYAALMTGIQCQGPVWANLLEARDRTDPMIEMSFLLHEICHFRDSEANARKLREIIAARPEACREVLDAAGIG